MITDTQRGFDFSSKNDAGSLLNVTFTTLGQWVYKKKTTDGLFSLKVCIIWTTKKIKDMYTNMIVTKEEMMEQSELNGYIFPILSD